jgi:hypothetical protein
VKAVLSDVDRGTALGVGMLAGERVALRQKMIRDRVSIVGSGTLGWGRSKPDRRTSSVRVRTDGFMRSAAVLSLRTETCETWEG